MKLLKINFAIALPFILLGFVIIITQFNAINRLPILEIDKQHADEWMVYLTIFQCGIFIMQSWVFGTQSIELKKTVKEMQEAKGISRDAANATLRAAEATEKSLREMQVANEVALKGTAAAELTAKAMIGIELPVLHIMDLNIGVTSDYWDKSFLPTLVIKNFGRTAAFVQEVIINSGFKRPNNKEICKRLDPFPEPFAIEPSETYERKGYSLKVRPEEVTKIQKDELTMYVYGLVKYQDFMGMLHETGFAYFWSEGNKKFLISPENNLNFKN